MSARDFKIIVVNDGSNESYDNIFNKVKAYAKVISYNTNKGKGYALKTGLKYIKDNYKTYIVITMESDGQHTVTDTIKLSEEGIKHNNALILGKRLRSNKTPLRSRFGNTITRFVYRITTGIDIYDTQTGLRAFSNKLTDFLIKY